MNKKEFVAFLKQRLSVLEEKEIYEIIDEYVQHIEMKVDNGQTEEEAIKDFGNLNEFVDEILSAYHVNPKESEAKNFVYDVIDQLARFVNKLADSILNLDSNQIIRLILEFFLLVIVLAVVKWPITLLLSMIFDIVFFLPRGVFSLLYGLLRFVFEVCYFAVSCFVIYTFAKQRIFVGDNEKTTSSNKTEREFHKKKEPIHEIKEEKLSSKKEKDIVVDLKTSEQKTYRKPEEVREQHQKARKENTKVSLGLEQIVLTIIKFFLLFILIPMIMMMILQFVGFGVLLGLLIKGVGFVGVFMILCGTLLITISIVSGLSSFIFKGGKQK